MLHDSIMTFLSVIPTVVHQDLDNVSTLGAQFSNNVQNAHSLVLHEGAVGQYTLNKKLVK